MRLTADDYLQMLDGKDTEGRVETLVRFLSSPLEEGVRPVLVRHYLGLTDRDGMPVSDSNHTEREEA